MDTIEVKRSETGEVVTIELARPEKKNAMNPQMHQEMHLTLSGLAADINAKVLVITGQGDAFCAGMDLKEYFMDRATDPDEMSRVRQLSQDWRARLLPSLPCVTIAKVNGYCFGGAFPIVVGCDLAISSDDAMFGLSEINFGQIPAGPVAAMLGRVVNDRDAMWHILTGEPFDGTRAAEMKLVNRSVPADQLETEVDQLVSVLMSKERNALRLAKKLYLNSKTMELSAALAYANATVAELTQASQGHWLEHGVADFLSKKSKPGKAE